MKTTGNNPAASFLKLILNMLWYILFVAFVLLFISTIITFNKYGMANFFWGLAFLAAFGLVLVIIYELRKIIQTLILRKPFNNENVKRFRTIGYSIFLIGGFSFVYDIVKLKPDSFYLLHIDASGVSTKAGALIYILLGCFSLVLAEVFQTAKNLEEENNLTI